MATHPFARDYQLLQLTHDIGQNGTPDLLRQWEECVQLGARVHTPITLSIPVIVSDYKQTVVTTAFEHMLRAWSLPNLVHAVQILGPQHTISLPHLTTRVPNYIDLYWMKTGEFCNVAKTMKHWAHYVNEVAEVKQWNKSRYVPATKTWVSPTPWPTTSIFAWEALWGRDFDSTDPNFADHVRCLQSHWPLMDDSALERLSALIAHEARDFNHGKVTSGSVIALLGFDPTVQKTEAYQNIVAALPTFGKDVYEKLVLENALGNTQPANTIKRKL